MSTLLKSRLLSAFERIRQTMVEGSKVKASCQNSPRVGHCRQRCSRRLVCKVHGWLERRGARPPEPA